MVQPKETFPEQSGAGGSLVSQQVEEGLGLEEGVQEILEAFQLLLQVATAAVVDCQPSVAAVDLAGLQNWEPEEKVPPLLDLVEQTPGAESQRQEVCCRTRWWKQVVWLGQKLTWLNLGLVGTASGQKVGGAGEELEAA